MSFRGFVPETSPTRGAGTLPPFGLRDETSFEASHNGSDVPDEELNVGVWGATSSALVRTEEEVEPTLETSLEPASCRVKHMARKKKFEPRGHLASLISEAEQMLGRPTFSLSAVEGFQAEFAFPGETEEGCEGDETPEASFATNGIEAEDVPWTPTEWRDPPPPPEDNDKEMETSLRASSASPKLVQPQQPLEEGVTGNLRGSPEVTNRDTMEAEGPRRSVPLPDVGVEIASEISSRP